METKGEERLQLVVKETRELITMLEQTSVQRVSLEAGKFKIQIERAASAQRVGTGEPSPTAAPVAQPPEGRPAKDTHHRIPAPLVGTFYRAPNPGAKPFVEVGARVQRGQTAGCCGPWQKPRSKGSRPRSPSIRGC